MSKQPANPPKKRGRPARKAESPAERLARLEAELEAARQEVAQAEQRKLATVGTAVLAEAKDNATFMAELRRILSTRVTTNAGKADIASLIESPTTSAAASKGTEPAGLPPAAPVS